MMRRVRVLLPVIIAIGVFLSFHKSVWAANIYYVAGDIGSDSNTATQAKSTATPWKTIQKAADNVVAGDTVNVKGGITYTGSSTCSSSHSCAVDLKVAGTSGNPITFQAWPGTGIPVINAQSQFEAIGNADSTATDYNIISGFYLTGATGRTINIGFAGETSNNTIIKNNIVDSKGASGIYLLNSDSNKVFNNTVYSAPTKGNLGIYLNGSTNSLAQNNIIIGFTHGLGGAISDSTNLYSNDTDSTGSSTNNVYADASFVNASGGDFHLSKGSPAIDVGTNLSSSGVVSDVAGVGRPQGLGFDIGAYEYYSIMATPVYPSGFIGDTKPSLVFKKAVSTVSSIGHYDIFLDSGKYGSYSVTQVPGSGNGTSSYTWRDDSNLRLEFLNEDDSDTTNDQIRVFFKGLNSYPLTEGKHTWTVTTYDSLGAQSSVSTDFYIETTPPSLYELSIANTATINSGGVYNLPGTLRTPAFSGRISDPYKGSSLTYSPSGLMDTFSPVSSGPANVTLTILKRNANSTYSDYVSKNFAFTSFIDTGTEKYARFYITTPSILLDGYYKVALSGTDNANNTSTLTVFYLSMNSGVTTLSTPLTPSSIVSPTPSSLAPVPASVSAPVPTPEVQNQPLPVQQNVNIFTRILNFFKKILNLAFAYTPVTA